MYIYVYIYIYMYIHTHTRAKCDTPGWFGRQIRIHRTRFFISWLSDAFPRWGNLTDQKTPPSKTLQ